MKLAQVERRGFDLNMTCLNLGHVEDVFDLRKQQIRRGRLVATISDCDSFKLVSRRTSAIAMTPLSGVRIRG